MMTASVRAVSVPVATTSGSVLASTGGAELPGMLAIPDNPRCVIAFAHGSGSSGASPRNRAVAEKLHAGGCATLQFDLLTEDEQRVDAATRELRFDIGLLGDRLTNAVDRLSFWGATSGLPIGLFGASTGAGAALVTAARRPERVRAVVSRGGRPDLAGSALPAVAAPTLLIVGGRDEQVLALNRLAADMFTAPVVIEVIPGATHLFEEPGALEQVADLAVDWFHEKAGTRVDS